MVKEAKKILVRKINSTQNEGRFKTKIFWKFVQSKTIFKEHILNIIDNDGNIQTDNLVKAELLNSFLNSVFTIDTCEIPEFEKRTAGGLQLC